jgi:hypothetical protein
MQFTHQIRKKASDDDKNWIIERFHGPLGSLRDGTPYGRGASFLGVTLNAASLDFPGNDTRSSISDLGNL